MSSNVAYTLVLVRHGESIWTSENKFCGWYDSDLAEQGVDEAKKAAKVTSFVS
jgi:2,3-bisphosphoglycerate-dependent phosphoglycerate mutase